MAKAAFWMTVATWVQVSVAVVGTFLLLLALYYSRKATEAATDTARAAIDANKLNREFFIAEQRAWIAPRNIRIASGLKWNNRSAKVTIECNFQNIGNTLAQTVHIFLALYLDHQEMDEYKRVSERAKILPFPNTIAFPHDPITQSWELTISEDMLNAHFREYNDMHFRDNPQDCWAEKIAIFPKLIGCVDYGLVPTGERKQLGFILPIFRMENVSGVIAIGPAFGDIPVEQLRIGHWAMGKLFAD